MRSRAAAHSVLALAFSCSIAAGCLHGPRGTSQDLVGSCPEQGRSWTRRELTEIALACVEKPGRIGRVDTMQKDCRIGVVVSWRQRARPNLFVVVSAIDGSVIEVHGGP